MKLTVEENRETIKRYDHIKPAPAWVSVRCSSVCPGTSRTCTLEQGHRGPHVSHGLFRKVLAVWDARAKVRESERKSKTLGPVRPGSFPIGGLVGALDVLRRRIVRRSPPVEEIFLIIFAVSMVGFAIDWALRILGLK